MKAGEIRVIALCVVWRDEAILVQEGSDPATGAVFYRIPGGGVEFGEYAVQAAVREIREELEAEVIDVRLLGVLENLFTYNGEQGHEIVFVCEGAVAEPLFYDQDEMIGHEGDDETFRALWLPLADALAGRATLYPDGLAALLQAHRQQAHPSPR
jgi:8-oxo-dGTP pyrophosphatase MutT (NUDIX family)